MKYRDRPLKYRDPPWKDEDPSLKYRDPSLNDPGSLNNEDLPLKKTYPDPHLKDSDGRIEAKTEITISQLKSGSMYQVPVTVVDTAAEVTIISDKVYASMADGPGTPIKVKMQTAGRELTTHAFIIGPTQTLRVTRHLTRMCM